mmetsp:Transcript_26808/g.59312  ORF Transcript_26808/g.59312 Transcript_26808/m.59312 type:complete len:222 (+) Transcript_26808:350-1015(+)
MGHAHQRHLLPPLLRQTRSPVGRGAGGRCVRDGSAGEHASQRASRFGPDCPEPLPARRPVHLPLPQARGLLRGHREGPVCLPPGQPPDPDDRSDHAHKLQLLLQGGTGHHPRHGSDRPVSGGGAGGPKNERKICRPAERHQQRRELRLPPPGPGCAQAAGGPAGVIPAPHSHSRPKAQESQSVQKGAVYKGAESHPLAGHLSRRHPALPGQDYGIAAGSRL